MGNCAYCYRNLENDECSHCEEQIAMLESRDGNPNAYNEYLERRAMSNDAFQDGKKIAEDILKDLCKPLKPEPVVFDQALRYNMGKTQYREVYPKFIEAIAAVMSKSRAKYPAFNWCKPTNYSTPLDSLHRHLAAFENGEDFDKETGEHHLAHVATNVMFLLYQFNNNPEMDDRFFKDKK